MMKTPDPDVQSFEKTSHALAVVNKGSIVYANRTFSKLYNNLKQHDKEKLVADLKDLHDNLQVSGKAVAKKPIEFSTADKGVDVFVYLLNKSRSKASSLLVLIEPKISGAGFQAPGTGQTANPHRPRGLAPEAYPALFTDRFPDLYPERGPNLGSFCKLPKPFSELIGEDSNFRTVLHSAQKAAKSDFPVLISGESGTGKELLARTIHQTSRRNRKKFVDINCAAIPDQLIDSELFGYEKGAFTGATPGGRHGLFVEAHRGTLFFDEIADASLQTQAKLLRVLNEGYFKRIGSTKNIRVDVRIISATNKDLTRLIARKRFREDLIYRLNTINIHIPPLRERPNDILLLANHFLKQHVNKQDHPMEFSPSCLEVIRAYDWPGNVRELKGVVDYAVTMAPGPVITRNYFPDFLLSVQIQNRKTLDSRLAKQKTGKDPGLLSTIVKQTEREVIQEVLQVAKNRSEAIQMLGISRRTFYTKLKQYNLD